MQNYLIINPELRGVFYILRPVKTHAAEILRPVKTHAAEILQPLKYLNETNTLQPPEKMNKFWDDLKMYN